MIRRARPPLRKQPPTLPWFWLTFGGGLLGGMVALAWMARQALYAMD
jgi:hypothetical protein